MWALGRYCDDYVKVIGQQIASSSLGNIEWPEYGLLESAGARRDEQNVDVQENGI